MCCLWREGVEGRRKRRSEEVRAVVRAAEEPRPVLWAPEIGVGKDVNVEDVDGWE